MGYSREYKGRNGKENYVFNYVMISNTNKL